MIFHSKPHLDLIANAVKYENITAIEPLLKMHTHDLKHNDTRQENTLFLEFLNVVLDPLLSDYNNDYTVKIISHYINNYISKDYALEAFYNILFLSDDYFLHTLEKIINITKPECNPFKSNYQINITKKNLDFQNLFINCLINKDNSLSFFHKYKLIDIFHIEDNNYSELFNFITKTKDKYCFVSLHKKNSTLFINKSLAAIDSEFIYGVYNTYEFIQNEFISLYTSFNNNEKKLTKKLINYYTNAYDNSVGVNKGEHYKKLEESLSKVEFYYDLKKNIPSNTNNNIKKPLKI